MRASHRILKEYFKTLIVLTFPEDTLKMRVVRLMLSTRLLLGAAPPRAIARKKES